MALLNRFSKLNDRGETGIFTFIVTKSVTRDFHRDATTKDFCFGYHRWAISFQRPTEKVLGVHLLLRNPTPSTACVVDFSLTLLNREHFSQNEVYTKRQAKFTITNPMQVSYLVFSSHGYLTNNVCCLFHHIFRCSVFVITIQLWWNIRG